MQASLKSPLTQLQFSKNNTDKGEIPFLKLLTVKR